METPDPGPLGRTGRTTSRRQTSFLIAATALVLVLTGCNSGDSDGDITGPPPPATPTGSIQVTATTVGWNLDPDGYAATVEGKNGAVPANGSVTITGVPTGSRSVTLGGLAGNCSPGGTNPRAVTVTENATTQVTFDVTCTLFRLENQIVFWESEAGDIQVFAMDPDGGRKVRISTRAGDDDDARISRDGLRIAFRGEMPRRTDIFVMNVDGTGLVNLTDDGDFLDEYPTWSPDGTRIVFERNTPDDPAAPGGPYDSEIFIMNADGSGLRNLTNNPGSGDSWPDWSPDGTRILFTSFRDGNNELYAMDTDGGNLVRLTNDPGGDLWARWSPDGTRIAYTNITGNNREIFVMNADGSGRVNLTNDPASDESPVWSPDGTKIAFGSDRDGNYGTWVMNADGTGAAKILRGTYPDDWGRR